MTDTHNFPELEDLQASRLTVLVPPGTNPKKAAEFALAHKGKVIFCKTKELEQPIIDATSNTKTNRGWFSWLWGSSSKSKKPEPEPEPADFYAEPYLITPQQLWINHWMKKFMCPYGEAEGTWDECSSDEKEWIKMRAEASNDLTIRQFIKDHPNARWTQTYLEQNKEN